MQERKHATRDRGRHCVKQSPLAAAEGMVASTYAVQSGASKLNMLRAGWGPLKTCGLWTTDRQRGIRKEMADGPAHELMMKAMRPVRSDGREGFVRFTHGLDDRLSPLQSDDRGATERSPRLQQASHQERS